MKVDQTALRILVLGATSAIAEATLRLWAARGERLFLVARNSARLAAIVADLEVRGGAACIAGAISSDLDPLDTHPGLLAAAWLALGEVDVVLIAHGQLPDQARCEREVSALMDTLQTNGLSVLSLCTLIANRMEAQGHGRLAVITSVAGDRGRQSNYAYGSAKGLVSRYLEGLRNRLAHRGVAVIDLRPGFVVTPMTEGLQRSGPLWTEPEDLARGIVVAIDRRRDIAYLPGHWRWIMGVIRLIPERLFKRLRL